MKIALVIPVYNEGERFKALLKKISPFFPLVDTIIVDDGSTDGAVEGLESGEYHIIRHRENKGKGQALRTGFAEAAQKRYDWALTIDADGQHDPSRIPVFIEAAESGRFGIIIGSRRKDLASMPLDRRFSNLTTSLILSIMSGQKILDAQCGYRMYSMNFLKGVNLETTAFDTESELLLSAFKRKIPIGWVDIPTIYTKEKSHIHRGMDTFRFIAQVFKYIFGRIN